MEAVGLDSGGGAWGGEGSRLRWARRAIYLLPGTARASPTALEACRQERLALGIPLMWGYLRPLEDLRPQESNRACAEAGRIQGSVECLLKRLELPLGYFYTYSMRGICIVGSR